ncbi:MAG: protein jag [Alkalibacterium sp.]|nr:protein jag [Alkalibacterium sp.]
MRDKYTAQATTTEEAINKGLKALGIKKEEAEISVSQESKKGFLGLGQKDAVVVVKRKNAKSAVEELVTKELILGEKEPSTIDPTKESKSEQPVIEPVAEKPEEVLEAREDAEADKSEDKPEPKESEDVSEEKTELKEKPEKKEVVLSETDESAIQSVADYIERIATNMGVEDVSVSINREDRRVQYIIDTEDAGLIIGRHGKVLNSLQTLAQIQLHQMADNKLFAKVDAENYRDRRQRTVEQLASRTAEKVKRTRRPVILEPMPAHERKQIHRFLNQHKGVQTHSEGKEPHRYLVVEPSKDESFKY